ncbi:hypothetical protein HanRHA438_Chr05g0206941 [Helianthus annuus]|nr:hypothetical protein HanRHA438_Chr05g0206941 [Helianthus annuus]
MYTEMKTILVAMSVVPRLASDVNQREPKDDVRILISSDDVISVSRLLDLRRLRTPVGCEKEES